MRKDEVEEGADEVQVGRDEEAELSDEELLGDDAGHSRRGAPGFPRKKILGMISLKKQV